MYIEYIDEVYNILKKTEIYINGSGICDYEYMMSILIDLFSQIKHHGKQVFFIGNGGSAAISSHMTADFMKNGGMNTYSLYDSAVTTCMGNDYGYKHVFDRPLGFLGQEGSLLVAISSSGNSENIISAIDTAITNKMVVLTLTGFRKDNIIKSKGNYNIYVPIEEYGKVETIHNLILQQVVDEIMNRDGTTL